MKTMDPKVQLQPQHFYFGMLHPWPAHSYLVWSLCLQRGQGTEVRGSLIIQAEPVPITQHTNKPIIHQPLAQNLSTAFNSNMARALFEDT